METFNRKDIMTIASGKQLNKLKHKMPLPPLLLLSKIDIISDYKANGVIYFDANEWFRSCYLNTSNSSATIPMSIIMESIFQLGNFFISYRLHQECQYNDFIMSSMDNIKFKDCNSQYGDIKIIFKINEDIDIKNENIKCQAYVSDYKNIICSVDNINVNIIKPNQ